MNLEKKYVSKGPSPAKAGIEIASTTRSYRGGDAVWKFVSWNLLDDSTINVMHRNVVSAEV